MQYASCARARTHTTGHLRPWPHQRMHAASWGFLARIPAGLVSSVSSPVLPAQSTSPYAKPHPKGVSRTCTFRNFLVLRSAQGWRPHSTVRDHGKGTQERKAVGLKKLKSWGVFIFKLVCILNPKGIETVPGGTTALGTALKYHSRSKARTNRVEGLSPREVPFSDL